MNETLIFVLILFKASWIFKKTKVSFIVHFSFGKYRFNLNTFWSHLVVWRERTFHLTCNMKTYDIQRFLQLNYLKIFILNDTSLEWNPLQWSSVKTGIKHGLFSLKIKWQQISFISFMQSISIPKVDEFVSQLHTYWRCPWCNGYRRRKWTRRHEFKSWTRLIAFHIALIPLRKVWIQLFSLQLWVNSRADRVLQPWWDN